jgi:lysophospholipase L1-like esterase
MSIGIGLGGGELILRLRDADNNAQAAAPVEGGAIAPDPVLGFTYNPALEGVNSLGLRNPEISEIKPHGAKRVLLLGDSVALLCLGKHNPPEGMVNRLRAALEGRAELINGAVPGYTIYQERTLLETRLLRFQPDLVILQHTLNDNFEFLHRYDPNSNILIALTEDGRRSYVAGVGGVLSWLSKYSYIALRAQYALLAWNISQTKYPWEPYPGFPQAWQDESWEYARGQLEAIRDLTAGAGGRLVVMSVPFGPQLEPELLASEREYTTKPQRKLRQLCAELNVPLLDLFDLFEKNGGPDLFYDLVHLVPEGHRLVSEALVQRLESDGLLPAATTAHAAAQ